MNKMNVARTLVLFMFAAHHVQAHVGFFQAKDAYPAALANATQAGAPLECGATTYARAHSDKYEACPTNCPYWAQNRIDTEVCTFVCATALECPKWNPNKPMADTIKKSRTCRGPRVQFCAEPETDGTDTCKVCQPGFKKHMYDGLCYFQYFWTLYVGVAIVLIIVGLAVAWFVDWCRRPTVNAEELANAEIYCNRTRILQPKNVDGHRHPYPIDTNLCTTDVAGLGMILHFRFQVFCIVWPLVIALFWAGFACFHEELWVLGTKNFGTPRHNCILVAWGYETQQRLMWTKVAFLVMTYIFSFVGFMLFSVSQYRTFQAFDAKEKTMKKFALALEGLPDLPGSKDLENDLKKAVEDATGQSGNIVGVSVAWRYGDNEEAIMKEVKKDQWMRQVVLTPRFEDMKDPTADMGPIRKKLYNWETAVFGPEEEGEEVDITQVLTEMVSSETAYVVFNTSEDADKALESTAAKGVSFKGSTLNFAKVDAEPTSVNWQNFDDSSPESMRRRLYIGLLKYYLPALSIWFFVFYVPYAISLYNFNYDNGAELPAVYSIVFTMIVVGGNAIMYQVCDLVSEEIGFKNKDTKQCVYLLMYLFACMFNVLLDMGVTYVTALKVMIGLDFRTYDGTRLEHIDSFTSQFETYAMQRSLGGNTFAYAFPSTFLIPFLIEPIITVVVPYRLGRLIIRTHSEVRGITAEEWIAPIPFDTGRYADILLNIFLGVLIFYFPGGYNFTLFIGMFISHIWIYLFDHWRVLRAIPAITITSYAIDWWAQAVLAGCCALILSTLVFKANCESYAGYCLKDMPLLTVTTVAGAGHFLVHMLLLIYVVPALGKTFKDENEDMKYSTVAENQPFTWFSANPVHCLRSKYIHNHVPYCRFAAPGKEHHLEVNTEIGCYFSDTAADMDDPNAPTMGGALDVLRKSLTKGKQSE